MTADPALVARWARAWAISRGVAPPVASDGGLYIHVGSDEQIGRTIFATLDVEAIRALTAQIDRPRLFLKVCAPAAAVGPLLPAGWEIAPPGYMMTAPVVGMLDRPVALPRGFDLRMREQDGIVFATVADAAGEEAARGRIVSVGNLVVFDRIRVADAHQRRGCGSAIMQALATAADARGIADAMLCATPAGRLLYETLGWSLHSDYTTASLTAA